MSKYEKAKAALGFAPTPSKDNKKEKPNQLLDNLLKVPKRDANIDTPHTQNPTQNAIHQADLLYLPDDEGYKYCLVVVDIATRTTDAQPLKERTSKVVLAAIKKIYKRKYLKEPIERIEVDSGSEFKDEFKRYFGDKIHEKESGRSRQQSVVETRNGLIGRLLNKRMLAQEILLEEDSREWVAFLPKVIDVINEFYTQEPENVDVHEPVRGSKNSLRLIAIGSQVHTQLDKPIGYIRGDRLHGKFRQGDIRWDKQVKTVSDIYLRPGQPPMYQVQVPNKPPNTNVAYTKAQLQVVQENEQLPGQHLLEKHTVEALLDRFKKNNRVYFKVKWKGDPTPTDEPRTTLLQDVPILVKEYEERMK